jgi:hypothetical protein
MTNRIFKTFTSYAPRKLTMASAEFVGPKNTPARMPPPMTPQRRIFQSLVLMIEWESSCETPYQHCFGIEAYVLVNNPCRKLQRDYERFFTERHTKIPPWPHPSKKVFQEYAERWVRRKWSKCNASSLMFHSLKN